MNEAATVRVADVLRAALDILSDEDYARLAARIDVIAEAPPEAKPYTLADLDALDLAHPGMYSGVEERERIVGEIRRLMGGSR